jgi:uncharacterized protein
MHKRRVNKFFSSTKSRLNKDFRCFNTDWIYLKFNHQTKHIMGKFIVTTRKDGEFQFNLKATNGQVILTSQGYTTKANCMNGIESVKKNSPLDERFERLESKNGKPYFNLKAGNSQIIGTSEMYESKQSMENGIASVKKNAPDAEVIEE